LDLKALSGRNDRIRLGLGEQQLRPSLLVFRGFESAKTQKAQTHQQMTHDRAQNICAFFHNNRGLLFSV
jgi:hypothetical protein